MEELAAVAGVAAGAAALAFVVGVDTAFAAGDETAAAFDEVVGTSLGAAAAVVEAALATGVVVATGAASVVVVVSPSSPSSQKGRSSSSLAGSHWAGRLDRLSVT